jgi:hypothetical protein
MRNSSACIRCGKPYDNTVKKLTEMLEAARRALEITERTLRDVCEDSSGHALTEEERSTLLSETEAELVKEGKINGV